jgi:hypothetical protein
VCALRGVLKVPGFLSCLDRHKTARSTLYGIWGITRLFDFVEIVRCRDDACRQRHGHGPHALLRLSPHGLTAHASTLSLSEHAHAVTPHPTRTRRTHRRAPDGTPDAGAGPSRHAHPPATWDRDSVISHWEPGRRAWDAERVPVARPPPGPVLTRREEETLPVVVTPPPSTERANVRASTCRGRPYTAYTAYIAQRGEPP